MTRKDATEKVQAALLAARAICDEAEKGKRDFSDEERGKIVGYMAEAQKGKDELKKLDDNEALKKAVLDMGAGREMVNQSPATSAVPAGQKGSVGERFVNSPAFKAWMAQYPEGHIPERARVQGPPVEFKNLMERKTLLTGDSDTSAGAFVATDYTGIYEALGRFPLGVLDLIGKRQTTSDLVEFVRQTAQVTQAAPVPEATATATDGYDEKPEGTTTFEKVTAPVRTIAAWIPATKRALADVAQLRGIIDSELRDDLQEELENQIINGAGTGENMTGLLATAGVLTQAWNTDILTTTRQAKTTLQVTGRARPTAYVMNPADWETIELLQDLAGRYYYGGPLSNGEPRLWGVPVVECQSLAEGQIILGDWRKAVLWDRERATISVSDSHSDFFIRNLIAILAEMRAAFGVIRPSAFVIIDATAGS